jgi:serine phosphatase RsbU (regulator of sigma subunit)
VNTALQRTLDRHHFITAIYGIVDEEQGKLTIARAGHTPLLLVRGNKVIPVLPKGMGLGISYTSLFDDSLEECVITLEPDDVLVLYTDGITESKNENNEDFGMQRLSELLLAWEAEAPEIIQNKILESLTVFSQNMQQHDDITSLIFKWVTNNLESSDGRISDSHTD